MWVLSMEIVSWRPSGALNFKVAPTLLEYMYTPGFMKMTAEINAMICIITCTGEI